MFRNISRPYNLAYNYSFQAPIVTQEHGKSRCRGPRLPRYVIFCIAAMAWLLRRYGEPIREFIERRLGLIAGIAAALLILLFVAAKFLRG